MKALLLAIPALVVQAAMCDDSSWSRGIEAELRLTKRSFVATEPIAVEVYLESTSQDPIHRDRFSPVSSSVGLPEFVIRRVADGKVLSISIGLYGNDWSSWYQPKHFGAGDFVLPPAGRVHLLSGDLRRSLHLAREYCQRALSSSPGILDAADSAIRRSYEETVGFVDEFRRGGVYDVQVRAYALSPVVRVEVGPESNTNRTEAQPGATDNPDDAQHL